MTKRIAITGLAASSLLAAWTNSAAGSELMRLEARFQAESLVALGQSAPPPGPVEGRFVLMMPPPRETDGMQIEERVGITLMSLKVGDVYFLPRQTRAVLTALHGTPIRLVIGGAADGPHALSADHNDFKLVFSRVPNIDDPQSLVFEEFSASLAGSGGAHYMAVTGKGSARIESTWK